MSRTFEIFEGNFVYILCRSLKTTVNKVTGPVINDGVLIAEDDEYFFLGKDGEEITDAIRKDDIVKIFLPIDELQDALMDGNESMN